MFDTEQAILVRLPPPKSANGLRHAYNLCLTEDALIYIKPEPI